MTDEDRFIRTTLNSCTGSDESTRMFVEIDTENGLSEIVIERSIRQRMPVQRIKKAKRLYEQLTGGSGRKIFKLEDLV